MVSCGNDRVVCVWDLRDIDQVAGKRGGIIGAFVTDTENGPAVIEPDANNSLARGDDLLGYESGGNVVKLATAAEFYETFWDSQPGSELVFHVRRNNAGRRVSLTVDQGIDERKPLFSLLLLDQPDQSISWLAWNPLGPFESSDRQIERIVGWHFNGDTGDASSFAPLREYREQYYRPDLISQLLRDPDKLPPREQPDPPVMDLSIHNSAADLTSIANRVVTRQKARAVLGVDPSFPIDLIESIHLELDEKNAGDFSLDGEGYWSCEISDDVLLDRQPHNVRAVLTTNEHPKRAFFRDPTHSISTGASIFGRRWSDGIRNEGRSIQFYGVDQPGCQ